MLEELKGLYSWGQVYLRLLPQNTLRWRLSKWLSFGSACLKTRFEKISTPTLIMTSGSDRLIPSKDEGERLKDLLVSAKVDVINFPNRGHILLNSEFDLAAVFQKSFVFKKAIDSFTFPSKEQITEARRGLAWYFNVTSPIFLTKSDGKLLKGVQKVPVASEVSRPVLFVVLTRV